MRHVFQSESKKGPKGSTMRKCLHCEGSKTIYPDGKVIYLGPSKCLSSIDDERNRLMGIIDKYLRFTQLIKSGK